MGAVDASPGSPLLVSVLPDVSGVHRSFTYEVPESLAGEIEAGVVVRVPLGARTVRGWVVDVGVDQDGDEGHSLRRIDAVRSYGPTAEVIELARAAAWRFVGPLRPFLVAATPPRDLRELPRGHRLTRVPRSVDLDDELLASIASALDSGVGLLRAPPAASRLSLVEGALAALRARGVHGTVLVLVPALSDMDRLVSLLVDAGEDVARYPADWARARAAARVVVGARSGALAPLEHLGAIVVLDAHDEAYVAERAPTWRADVLCRMRAESTGVPCLLISPVPGPELVESAPLVELSPERERSGWARVEILDRRGDDPRSGLFSPGLAEIIRGARLEDPGRPVIAVLNRTGRARLLACGSCGSLVTCERCGAALREASEQSGSEALYCSSCGLHRPALCASCGSMRLKALRVGVARVAEELGALVGEPAVEVSSATSELPLGAGLVVGTEAVLHRGRSASLVVFLDFDQELLAPRLRAPQEALVLLARASRLVGPRGPSRGSFPRRVVVQTRLPDHAVLLAAHDGLPGSLAAIERARRLELQLPPFSAIALLSGPEAKAVAEELALSEGVDVATRDDGYLVRARSTEQLCDALLALDVVERDLRIAIDPERV